MSAETLLFKRTPPTWNHAIAPIPMTTHPKLDRGPRIILLFLRVFETAVPVMVSVFYH